MNSGYDQPVESPAVWLGSQIDYRTEGMHTFSAHEIAEIDAALAHLCSLGPVDLPQITPETFPLPTFGRMFQGFGDYLREGRGFLLLRGLPRERYSVDDLARIYFGIGVHVGRPTTQSGNGEFLGHVMNVSDGRQPARAYKSGGELDMHTDSCDIVGLLCLQAARSGGISRIASAGAVHNRLLKERPDLLKELYGEYVYRRTESDAAAAGGPVARRAAVFSRESGDFTCYLHPGSARKAAAAGDFAMTAPQEEALEEVERLAASPEFHLDMSIGEGDIQFLNNRVLLHARTNYEDWPQLERRRHLMRLWLSVPSWPRMPSNQCVHAPQDYETWLRNRVPYGELPSHYFAQIQDQLALETAQIQR